MNAVRCFSRGGRILGEGSTVTTAGSSRVFPGGGMK